RGLVIGLQHERLTALSLLRASRLVWNEAFGLRLGQAGADLNRHCERIWWSGWSDATRCTKGCGMRKFVVPGVIGLLIATAIGWYFVSPTWTLHQMASAARAKDADRLSAYIDFPKLRDTTKAQLKAQASARIASGNSKGFEALGLIIGVPM